MYFKICKTCKKEQKIDDFHHRIIKETGEKKYETECKLCRKQYRIDHKEEIKIQRKNYREKNKNIISERNKIYSTNNRDSILEKKRNYTLKNKDKKREYDKKYREEKKEEKSLRDKIYYENNKEKIFEKAREYNKKRRSTDINYKVTGNLRNRVYCAITKRYKINKSFLALELLGCSVDECREYLELQFKEGMSWDNYGTHGWHIDHISPCASFDLTDPEQQKICFHYTNLQPLWATDNIKKGFKK
jgi:hypothetical protein